MYDIVVYMRQVFCIGLNAFDVGLLCNCVMMCCRHGDEHVIVVYVIGIFAIAVSTTVNLRTTLAEAS